MMEEAVRERATRRAGGRLARRAFVVCATLCLAYLSLASDVAGLRYWFVSCVVAGLVLARLANWLERSHVGRLPWGGAAAAAMMTLLTLLACDTAYNVALRIMATPLPFQFELTDTVGALEMNLGLPRYLRDGQGRNKPGVVAESRVFGELVPPALLGDREFRDAVVEYRQVRYRLDEWGYRNPPGMWSEADCVALGDSFVFAASTPEEVSWVQRMHVLGHSIYNLGESGSSPVGQWERFQTQLRQAPNESIRRVVWMIFGGNDMRPESAVEFAGDRGALLQGTPLVGPLRTLEAIRDDSILARLRTGRLRPLWYDGPSYHDGRLLPAPLYRSPKWGAKLFYRPYLEVARRQTDWTGDEPYLTLVAERFAALRELAESREWQVLIVYAPSAAQIFGAEFDAYPEVGTDYFRDWLVRETETLGLECLDLSEALRAGADEGLPYYRDDTHWNAWGHAIAAREIDAALRN